MKRASPVVPPPLWRLAPEQNAVAKERPLKVGETPRNIYGRAALKLLGSERCYPFMVPGYWVWLLVPEFEMPHHFALSGRFGEAYRLVTSKEATSLRDGVPCEWHNHP